MSDYEDDEEPTLRDELSKMREEIASLKRSRSSQPIQRPAYLQPIESTDFKKLKASLAGVLDRSSCSHWEKRSALFDTLNKHKQKQ